MMMMLLPLQQLQTGTTITIILMAPMMGRHFTNKQNPLTTERCQFPSRSSRAATLRAAGWPVTAGRVFI
jgi:hypothetical protein